MDWPLILVRILEEQPCVVVTLNLILGSAPRESGSRMLVTAAEVHGSIGGGNLEFSATGKARELLADSDQARQLHEPWGLGPALNQCCGGAVTLHFEVVPQGVPVWLQDLQLAVREDVPAVLASAIDRDPPQHILIRTLPVLAPGVPIEVSAEVPAEVAQTCDELLASQGAGRFAPPVGPAVEQFVAVDRAGDIWWLEAVRCRRVPLVLFGAGHVGSEVARLLERLPFDVTWVDSREGQLPIDSANGIRTVCSRDPAAEVAQAAPGSVFVVMTHSHELDEDICFEILSRDDFCWLGLIGSETKRKRFVQRLNRRDISAAMLERLVCPVGLVARLCGGAGGRIDGISGKQPATIALSLVAQLMLEKPWMHANN